MQFERFYSLNNSVVRSIPHLHHLGFQTDTIQYVGLGWEEAYHPWSKGGYIYTPNELLRHFTMVVIPLQRTKIVPEHLPMNLPTRSSLLTLETKASDIVDMDSQSTQQNTQLRMDTYRESELLEEEGIGDQLSDLQQKLEDFLTARNWIRRRRELTCCVSM